MTHIDNIAHILLNGITHRNSINANPSYVPIGDGAIIQRRSAIYPNVNPTRSIGDYIPFYFHYKMPMLYVIQKNLAPQFIIYCVTNIQEAINSGVDFIFSDGHAVNGISSFYTKDQVNQILSLLDFTAIKERYWKSDTDLDLKRRKEAEFLFESDLPINHVKGFVVYNQFAFDALITLGVPSNQIFIRPNFYF